MLNHEFKVAISNLVFAGVTGDGATEGLGSQCLWSFQSAGRELWPTGTRTLIGQIYGHDKAFKWSSEIFYFWSDYLLIQQEIWLTLGEWRITVTRRINVSHVWLEKYADVTTDLIGVVKTHLVCRYMFGSTAFYLFECTNGTEIQWSFVWLDGASQENSDVLVQTVFTGEILSFCWPVKDSKLLWGRQLRQYQIFHIVKFPCSHGDRKYCHHCLYKAHRVCLQGNEGRFDPFNLICSSPYSRILHSLVNIRPASWWKETVPGKSHHHLQVAGRSWLI